VTKQKLVVNVSAVIVHHGCVLMIKQSSSPKKDAWMMPSTALHLGESLQQAIDREVPALTGITVEAGPPLYNRDFFIYDKEGNVERHFMVIDIEADYVKGIPKSSSDDTQVAWVSAPAMDLMEIDGGARTVLEYIEFL